MSEICPSCATRLPGPGEDGYLRVPVWLTSAGVACSEKCARALERTRRETP